jgi:hypothetical protein
MDSEPHPPLLARVDWEAADRVRTAYWVERLRRLGPAESFRVAAELWRHVRAVRPDWPDRAEREDDLAAHAMVREALSLVQRRCG